MKRFFMFVNLVLTLAIIVVCFTGCQKDSNDIKIGAILPLTGDAAKYGDIAKKSFDMAVNEVNASDGIKGKKIKIIYEDSQGNPQLGVSAVQKLISTDRVISIMGDLFSSVTLAIAPIVEKNKIVLLSPASSAPKITEAGDYIFRNCPSDVYEGNVMANYAYDKLNMKKVALLYVNNEYGIGIKDVFKESFSKKGGTIIDEESFEQNTTDFRTQLAKIKQSNPEAVYLVGYKEMGYILKQAKEMKIRPQFLSTVMFEDPDILKIAQEGADNVIYSASSFDTKNDDNPIVQSFVKSFNDKYGQMPDIFAGLSYDAMKIMIIAIEQGGNTSEGIKKALYNIKNYQGVTGEVSFDSNGDAILTPVIKKVENGKFVFVR